jgi:hypothetical protein
MTIYVNSIGDAHTSIIRFIGGPDTARVDTGDWTVSVPFPDHLKALRFLLGLRPHNPSVRRIEACQ